MSNPLALQDVVALGEVIAWTTECKQVRYLTDAGDIREPHLRGFVGDISDVTRVTVRLSDWYSEWTVPLLELAAKRRKRELGLK